MRTITIRVSEQLAKKLAAEAALRNLTLEELATERVTHAPPVASGFPVSSSERPLNSLQLAEIARNAPSARKSPALIDSDVDALRNEW